MTRKERMPRALGSGASSIPVSATPRMFARFKLGMVMLRIAPGRVMVSVDV